MITKNLQNQIKSKKILIIFDSGSGSTKTIAEILKERIKNYCDVDIYRVSDIHDPNLIAHYDFLIFGTPTYNCHPSKSIYEFIANLSPLSLSKKCVIYATFGFYCSNTLKTIANVLKTKNINPVGYLEIRGPASDFAIITSWTPGYARNTLKKIDLIIENIFKQLDNKKIDMKSPPLKLFSFIIDPIIYLADKFCDSIKSKIHVINERCNNCGNCLKICGRECWTIENDYPSHNPANCELCLGCVHGCPSKAIVLANFMKNNNRLNDLYYKKQKERLITTQSNRSYLW